MTKFGTRAMRVRRGEGGGGRMSSVQDNPMMVDDESGDQMSGSSGAAPRSGYHCLLKNGRSLCHGCWAGAGQAWAAGLSRLRCGRGMQ